MSATPLDSLLLATANQPGLLTPVSRPADARGDDFQDHLRDANKVTETKDKAGERGATQSDKSPAAAKTATDKRTDDAEKTSTDAHGTEDHGAQPQAADRPAAEKSQAETETDQPDGDEVVVVAEAPQTVETAVDEAAVVEIVATGESGEREANEDEPAASDTTQIDETTQTAEAVLKPEIPASEVEPELNPVVANEQSEPTVVTEATSVVAEVAETLSSEAQPVDVEQKAAVKAAPDSQSAVAVPQTEVETATSGEEIIDATPSNPQNKGEQVAPTATTSQSATLDADTSTDQDQPQQEGSSKRSFGTSKPSGELTETNSEKANQPLTTAKSELAEFAADINTAADRSPVEPIANAATPTDNGRSEGLLGALGKMQQSAGRTVQSSSESGPSNQPRVDSARFVGRVARAFQIAQDRGGTIQLRLSPPELGSLKLQITIEQGVLSATIDAETDAARNALLDNLPALRAKLAEQDIRIDKFDVNVDHEGGESPQEFETQEREQRGNSPSRQALRRNDPQADEQTAPAIDITEITTSDNNINLLI